MKRFTMLMIAAAGALWTRDASADAAACKIPQMTKWKVPTDTCISKLRNRPYESGFAAREDVMCEGWRAVWNTKNHVHELAEGKTATPPTSFAARHGCDDDGNDVVCVMALRQLSIGQPFPTICVRSSQGGSPAVMDVCVRGNLDWPNGGARPVTLSEIKPPDPPPRGNVNCTTCHIKPFIASTRHFVYSLAGVHLTDNGTPDAEGNWRNMSAAGQDAIKAINRVNRLADRNPTGWKWAEVDDLAWFGKNSNNHLPRRGTWLARNCAGGVCHNGGFAVNNHANWTQHGDQRDIPAMGGARFMDKNYCEHVVAPAFAHPDKPITFDNTKFRGGMRQLMIDEPARRWPSEEECRSFWKAIGCEPDAKQPSLIELCKKDKYPEMFQ